MGHLPSEQQAAASLRPKMIMVTGPLSTQYIRKTHYLWLRPTRLSDDSLKSLLKINGRAKTSSQHISLQNFTLTIWIISHINSLHSWKMLNSSFSPISDSELMHESVEMFRFFAVDCYQCRGIEWKGNVDALMLITRRDDVLMWMGREGEIVELFLLLLDCLLLLLSFFHSTRTFFLGQICICVCSGEKGKNILLLSRTSFSAAKL